MINRHLAHLWLYMKIHRILTHACLHQIGCLCYCCYAINSSSAVQKRHSKVYGNLIAPSFYSILLGEDNMNYLGIQQNIYVSRFVRKIQLDTGTLMSLFTVYCSCSYLQSTAVAVSYSLLQFQLQFQFLTVYYSFSFSSLQCTEVSVLTMYCSCSSYSVLQLQFLQCTAVAVLTVYCSCSSLQCTAVAVPNSVLQLQFLTEYCSCSSLQCTAVAVPASFIELVHTVDLVFIS